MARLGAGASRVGRVPDLARPGSGAEASGEGRRAKARLYGDGAVGGVETAVEAVVGYWDDFSDVVEVALKDAPQLRETRGMQEAGS